MIYSLDVLLSQFGTSLLFHYLVLTVASWPIQISQEAGKMVWYSHLSKNFPQFVVISTVKGFCIINKAKVDVFLEFSCFLYDPTDVDNLISSSFAVFKSSLNIWKFMVHILLKPGLRIFTIFMIAKYDVSCRTYNGLYHVEVGSFPLCLLYWVFIMNRCWILSKGFSPFIEMIIRCLFLGLLMWCVILIDLRILKNPWILRINPTWSWCMIILMYFWFSFLVFCWGFLHLFVSDISL